MALPFRDTHARVFSGCGGGTVDGGTKARSLIWWDGDAIRLSGLPDEAMTLSGAFRPLRHCGKQRCGVCQRTMARRRLPGPPAPQNTTQSRRTACACCMRNKLFHMGLPVTPANRNTHARNRRQGCISWQ
ncbi:protein of unknown function [Rhodovastum atsumiense]|nr:protein of unknown function [Rhodovastum atsumiense]